MIHIQTAKPRSKAKRFKVVYSASNGKQIGSAGETYNSKQAAFKDIHSMWITNFLHSAATKLGATIYVQDDTVKPSVKWLLDRTNGKQLASDQLCIKLKPKFRKAGIVASKPKKKPHHTEADIENLIGGIEHGFKT